MFLTLFPVLSGVFVVVFRIGSPYSFFVQGAFMLMPIIIALVFVSKKKIPLSELGFKGIERKKYLLYLPCLLLFLPTAALGFEWKGALYFLGALFLYLTVGFAEELYFRSINSKILNKTFDTLWVIIISTILFGIVHASTAFSGANLAFTLLTILNALLFGWMAIELYIVNKSILPVMAIHFLFNFESKFTLISGDNQLVAEIIRGAIMFVYAVILAIYIYKKKGCKKAL